MSERAPDYFGPFGGWRAWRVARADDVERYRLVSLFQHAVWPICQELRADCSRRRAFALLRRRSPHRAPTRDCQCGIHVTTLDELEPLLDEQSGYWSPCVVGEVAFWGTVVECERGWRASCAYPVRIFIPARQPAGASADELAHELSDYGVPVELLPACTGREAIALLGPRRGRLGSLG